MSSKIFYERVYKFNDDYDLVSETLFELGFSNFYTLENDEGVFLILVSDKPKKIIEIEQKLPFNIEFVEQRETSSEEWVKNIISKPFEFIDGVYIDPDHHDIDADIVIKIIPGLAFGTGLHATTKLAGEMLKKYLKPGMKVLDLGCGSGILSILAKKLGASKVVGVDNDKIAVEVANENIELNKISDVEIKESDLLKNVKGKFDLIVSNIIAEILIEALKKMPEYLEDGGIVILSGIIDSKLDLFKNLNIIEHRRSGEWNSLVIKF